MPVVGIVGGVASGKSLVARVFGELGAFVVNVDQLGHEVLRQPPVIAELRVRWGDKVLDQSGQIDRALVAAIVFRKECSELSFLEHVTHPRITKSLKAAIQRARDDGENVIVLDAAVLLKSGWDTLCDKIAYADAPRKVRETRCLDRGWSREQLAARETAQLSTEIKRKRADIVIDNSTHEGAIRAQIERFWNTLVT